MAEPQSLWQLLGGGNFRNALGEEDPKLGFGDALAQRSNSLIGMGGALLAGEGWGGAARGYGQGAQQDANIAYRQAQMKQHAQDKALQQAQQKQAQSNWERSFGLQERQFARGDETPFSKVAQDLNLRPGTPEYLEAARLYHMPKTEGAGQITKLVNPQTGEEENVIYNPRLPADQQFRPIPSTAFGAQTPTSAPAAVGGGPADLPPRLGPKAFEPEQKLRKEFEDSTKVHREVRQSYNRVLASKDDAAGDLALIFGYMKMLDPGSVVRETEFANAQNAAGVPDQIRNMYNKVLTGQRLNPNQRDQFKGQAGAIHDKYDTELNARADQFRSIARQYRIDPSRVIPDLGPLNRGEQRKPVTDPSQGLSKEDYRKELIRRGMLSADSL